MKTGMEFGCVKFFDTREGKLFGFLVDSEGTELFFHYSGGRTVRTVTGANVAYPEIAHPSNPLRFPKKGDRVMFYRGRNAKGTKATAWCFESDYEDAIDASKRNYTFEEAKDILAYSKVKGFEFVQTKKNFGATIVTVSSNITWTAENGSRVAEGNFKRVLEKRGEFTAEELLSDKGATVKGECAVVDVYTSDRTKFHNTRFQLGEANVLQNLGKVREEQKGVYESVSWNGGSDFFVVDPNDVRYITDDEYAMTDTYTPWLGDHEWLKCSFVQKYGHMNQVVKIIAHLGGHE